ncbi:MAG: ComEC/Rec2 family competence protein [Gaiellaceae bacterium]
MAAVCVGLAASNLVRFAPVPALAVVACARAPCVLAAAGWWWGTRRLDALGHSVLLPSVGTAERALVVTEEPPRIGKFDIRARALVLRWGDLRPHEPVLLQLGAGRAPPQGSRISVVGVLRLPRGPSNGFDESSWLHRQGVHVVLKAKEWRVVGRRGGIAGVGDRLQRWLSADSAYGLHGERRSVVDAIVLGHAEGLDDSLLARFRASGLYHCLAVDGLKVATVAAGAMLLVRRRFAGQLAALAAVGAYVLAVGLHPSVVRAAVAATLGSLAWLFSRQRDSWHALLVGAVVLLAWNPMFVLDAGFQLSFGAVAGIFVVTPRVVRALEGYPVPRWLAQLIGVSTACGLATAPVTWMQFHQISLVTVPANVVAVPVVAEMLVLALVTALIAPVAPPVAAALGQVNGWGAWFVAGCARVFGGLPGAQVTSPPGAALVAAGALLAGAYAWRHGHERAEAGVSPLGQRPAEDRAGPAPSA